MTDGVKDFPSHFWKHFVTGLATFFMTYYVINIVEDFVTYLLSDFMTDFVTLPVTVIVKGKSTNIVPDFLLGFGKGFETNFCNQFITHL